MSIIYKAPARLDAWQVKQSRQEFEKLAFAQGDVVVDMARTEVLDGSGVGAMVFAFKRLAADGKRLTVRNVSGQPLNLLNDAGLLRTLGGEQPESFLWAALRRFRGESQVRAPKVSPAPAPVPSAEPMVAAERAKGAA